MGLREDRPIVAITAEGDDLDAARHGAKAVGLQRLMRFGLAVPPAIAVSIETAATIAESVRSGVAHFDVTGLADAVETLAADRLAVRSGAAISLPGAFRSLLNVAPEDVPEAIGAVVASTRGLRVETLVRAMGVEEVPPTAIVVQGQVDTTADPRSGAGAATSRDTITGGRGLCGSMAWQMRGDAVMAGTVAVEPISALARQAQTLMALDADLARLDAELGAPVEVEFAVEEGRLWYLQLRTLKAPALAKTPQPEGELLGHGRPASPGVGVGELYVDVDDALDAIEAGHSVVIALNTAGPSDVAVMVKAAGVLTVLGGPDCHAAVVTRGAEVPAVVSVQGFEIGSHGARVGDVDVPVGSLIAVDGTRGQVRLQLSDPGPHDR